MSIENTLDVKQDFDEFCELLKDHEMVAMNDIGKIAARLVLSKQIADLHETLVVMGEHHDDEL